MPSTLNLAWWSSVRFTVVAPASSACRPDGERLRERQGDRATGASSVSVRSPERRRADWSDEL
jgi:hypothetical protein